MKEHYGLLALLLLIEAIFLLSGISYAVYGMDFEPKANVSLQGRYGIYNGTQVQANGFTGKTLNVLNANVTNNLRSENAYHDYISDDVAGSINIDTPKLVIGRGDIIVIPNYIAMIYGKLFVSDNALINGTVSAISLNISGDSYFNGTAHFKNINSTGYAYFNNINASNISGAVMNITIGYIQNLSVYNLIVNGTVFYSNVSFQTVNYTNITTESLLVKNSPAACSVKNSWMIYTNMTTSRCVSLDTNIEEVNSSNTTTLNLYVLNNTHLRNGFIVPYDAANFNQPVFHVDGFTDTGIDFNNSDGGVLFQYNGITGCIINVIAGTAWCSGGITTEGIMTAGTVRGNVETNQIGAIAPGTVITFGSAIDTGSNDVRFDAGIIASDANISAVNMSASKASFTDVDIGNNLKVSSNLSAGGNVLFTGSYLNVSGISTFTNIVNLYNTLNSYSTANFMSNTYFNGSTTFNNIIQFKDKNSGNIDLYYGSSTCYQETANISTSCGGLSTGSYSYNNSWFGAGGVKRLYDGDWGTGTHGNGNNYSFFFINYSKPIGSMISSEWLVEEGASGPYVHHVYNLNASCWNQEPLQLMIGSDDNTTILRCWNGSEWDFIDNIVGLIPLNEAVSEEAMRWYINQSREVRITNISINQIHSSCPSSANNSDIYNAVWNGNPPFDKCRNNINIDSNLTFANYQQIIFNVTQEDSLTVDRFQLPGVNPPSQGIAGAAPYLAYDKNTNESAFASWHVPPDYMAGSPINIDFYWTPDSAGDTGDVLWCVRLNSATSESDYINNTAYRNCVVDAAQNLRYELLKTSILATGIKPDEDDTVFLEIYRGASDATDTYNNDALLTQATVYYTSDSLGDQ